MVTLSKDTKSLTLWHLKFLYQCCWRFQSYGMCYHAVRWVFSNPEDVLRSFRMLGTTCPVTQNRIPQDWNLQPRTLSSYRHNVQPLHRWMPLFKTIPLWLCSMYWTVSTSELPKYVQQICHTCITVYPEYNTLTWRVLVPKFAGSNLAEAVGFLGRKNPQHAFLWRGSKAVGPVS